MANGVAWGSLYRENSGVLCKVSTADSVAIWLYIARILGWIQNGDKLLFIMIQPELMESRYAMSKYGSTGQGSAG
jgi:hypothetical protein